MTSTPAERLKLAQAYLAEREKRDPKLTPSRTYVNSTMRESYTGNRMGTSRDGANDFQQVQSVRMDAQIRRAV